MKHGWALSYSEAVAVQEILRSKISQKDNLPKNIRTIAGIDVSYSKSDDTLYAVIAVFDFKSMSLLELARHSERARFPYIPGLLSFREAPAILKAYKKLKLVPDILMFDGHGVAHPRGFGIASHAGLLLGIPSIGCAKKVLYGTYSEPAKGRGRRSLIKDPRSGKTLGIALRTRKNVKPVFVSCGNAVSAKTSADIVMRVSGSYRIPLPIREAHIQSNIYRQGQRIKGLK